MLRRLLPFLPKPPVVSVVRLAGMISPTPQPFRGGLSLPSVAGTIERACTMSGVLAVALQVNSPGGSPVQSSLIAKRVRNVAKEHDLPVFAFVEDVAASGGYWLACAADEIYAERSSIVGSIGVVSAPGFGFVEAARARWGSNDGFTTAGYATNRSLDPFLPEDPEDLKRLTRDPGRHPRRPSRIMVRRPARQAAEAFRGRCAVQRRIFGRAGGRSTTDLIDGHRRLAHRACATASARKVDLRVIGGQARLVQAPVRLADRAGSPSRSTWCLAPWRRIEERGVPGRRFGL